MAALGLPWQIAAGLGCGGRQVLACVPPPLPQRLLSYPPLPPAFLWSAVLSPTFTPREYYERDKDTKKQQCFRVYRGLSHKGVRSPGLACPCACDSMLLYSVFYECIGLWRRRC